MFQEINKKYPQIQFRYLKYDDCDRGLYQLLSQLTKAPPVPKQKFQEQLNLMIKSNISHINIVGYDKKTNKLVAFGSIIVCQTIFGKVGKIQNIVTCQSIRGKGFGKVIIEILKNEGWKNMCQKITLFCEDKNVRFYQKLGFKQMGSMFAAYK